VTLIRHSLKNHGIALGVIVMNDGAKALDFVDDVDAGTAPCPALVILDLNLPKASGRDVLQRIRQSPICGSVPVAVFSSSGAEKDRADAASLGANQYIQKPLDLDEFLKVGGILRLLLEQ
jgi:two-component system response regulator